jgi:hypothetical protein
MSYNHLLGFGIPAVLCGLALLLGGCAVTVTALPCPVLASHLPVVLDPADTRATKLKVANANSAFAEVCPAPPQQASQ